MQIVTDSAADLAPSQIMDLPIHMVPLRLSLCGKTYIGGKDISYAQFYQMLSETDEFPQTSQASVCGFAETYRSVAKEDPEILSIHISSGLSGTINAAKTAAAMVPEARITFLDSKTLSAAMGWQVQAAALMAKKNWSMDQIRERLSMIRDRVDGMFTMKDMKYLIHGGRISHIKGLMAQVLNIKPTIGVSHETGMYVNEANDMTFKRAVSHMLSMQWDHFRDMGRLRVQFVHGNCPDGVNLMRQKILEKMNIVLEDTVIVAPALGAHVGPSLTGIIVGPMDLFSDLL